jgi:NAD(P)-dependent dehydrogenase (short-subunit alcohol dehydrogenase family)
VRLQDKVVIVTGGASGIGEAASRLFAQEGGTIAVVDVNGPAGESVAKSIRDEGGRAEYLSANVADYESVRACVDAVTRQHGRLDVMFNNAGIGAQTTDDEAGWWRLLRINLLGVAWGIVHASKAMRESGGGSIINTGSHAGQRGCRQGIYGASKAAVHTLTRHAALYLAPDRIRVNAVLPGNIYTPIHDARRHDAIVRFVDGDRDAFNAGSPQDSGPPANREAMIKEFQRIHPMGRLGREDDIAQAALFLASDDAAIVTGNEFLVNGGIFAAQMRDRIVGTPATAPQTVLPPAKGTVAIISGNRPMAEALAARFERDSVTVAVANHAKTGSWPDLQQWLDQLGNLAGIVFALRPDSQGDLFTQGPKDWEEELAINYRLPWMLGQHALKAVVPGGWLTFVADAAGLTGAGSSPAFAAASAALIYSTDDLAHLLRPRGIRVNILIPELSGRSTNSPGLGLVASPADIAEVAVALARNAAGLTGLQVSLETSHPDHD